MSAPPRYLVLSHPLPARPWIVWDTVQNDAARTPAGRARTFTTADAAHRACATLNTKESAP